MTAAPVLSGCDGRCRSGDRHRPFLPLPLTDHVAALRCALGAEELSAPVDFTTPQPATIGKVIRAQGRVRERPARGTMVVQPQRCRGSAEDR
ncbi:hypothetical protein [Streptomyces broussonetiae]|uniref:Uncharacterized protein n=1 Tax=Streptomyces broussonetiae TaxID=2686304 RepID=A0A6I6MQG9_9ACTN|nr:hypothetical protein [Streptomyces broussonetiae]QHA02728.1 hypothetical protein GQF42_05000 [Streptomyces broussonetiae]